MGQGTTGHGRAFAHEDSNPAARRLLAEEVSVAKHH